jgi:two-component system chemotaxis response regulator CheY
MAAVLIVDSYADEGEMYADYLRSVGSNVEHVRTPEQALSLLESDRPLVIVTDMVFKRSRYDGPSFMRAVRARPECSATSFIVVSGFTRTADRDRARAAGADLFLLKPCAPDALWRYINSAIWAHGRHMRAQWNWPEDLPEEQDFRFQRS